MESIAITHDLIKQIIDEYLLKEIKAISFDNGVNFLKLIENAGENENLPDLTKVDNYIISLIQSKFPNANIDTVKKFVFPNDNVISVPSLYLNGTKVDNISCVYTFKANAINAYSVITDIITYLSSTDLRYHINIIKNKIDEPTMVKVYTNNENKESIEDVLLSIDLDGKVLPLEKYALRVSSNIQYDTYDNKLTSLNVLSKTIIEAIENYIEDMKNKGIEINPMLMEKYNVSKNKYLAIKNILIELRVKDFDFYETLTNKIMENIKQNELLANLYDILDNVKENNDSQYEKIIPVSEPIIIHEEYEKTSDNLTEEERNNLIRESEELAKLEKYEGLLTIDEANEEIKPGLTTYDYLEQNNVLSLIPLNAIIMLDDGVSMTGREFIKERVIPGAKLYNQESVIETILKYSTAYMQVIDAERIKTTGIFK